MAICQIYVAFNFLFLERPLQCAGALYRPSYLHVLSHAFTGPWPGNQRWEDSDVQTAGRAQLMAVTQEVKVRLRD